MTRITVDVNDEWLEAARAELGTETKVATINAALQSFATRQQAKQIVTALDQVPLELPDTDLAWGYGGGRDLTRLVADARECDAA